jgi:GMP synthase-like glutamine amidotransferase
VSACGGELAQMDHRIQGTQTIRMVDKQLPFSEIQVYESHRWVIKRLSKEFEVLAESDQGPEVIRHVTRPIYGLQFHPEKCVDELQGDDLFRSIIAKLHLA